MNTFDSNSIAWVKMKNLVPAIVQDAETGLVLMLAYMNPEALAKTVESGWVTFYSRSKQALWTKGETSGNKMKLVSIMLDCDQDTLLVLVNPLGPACHTGAETCFGESGRGDWAFVAELEQVLITPRIFPVLATPSSILASIESASVGVIAAVETTVPFTNVFEELPALIAPVKTITFCVEVEL